MSNFDEPNKKVVVMAKDLASQWLRKRVSNEYRLKVYSTSTVDFQSLPSILKSLRDQKIKVGGIREGLSDMGVSVGFDYISVWSSNRESLIQLKDWLEKRGFETSGIW